MREVKAYIRPEKVEDVIRALRDAGVPHVTVLHVRSFGSGIDPDHKRMSMEAGEWYTEKAKLEFVCSASDLDVLVPVIQVSARTGDPGDGVIFVSSVERAVKIRTGSEGEAALE